MPLPQQRLGYEAFALRLSLLGMPFPISVTQPGIHFLPWHWVLWMQIRSQNPFCFRETILPRKRIFHPLVVSVFVGGWFLHIYGSVTILVSARVFGWLVMPLVRAFDPEQQQLEDRLLVANRSNNSSLRLHYMAAMFCNWGIKKMEKMNLWSQVCRACQSVLMFFLFYESICLATWQRK